MCDNHQKPITATDTPAFFGIDRYGFPEAGEHPLDPPEYYPPYFGASASESSATTARSCVTGSTG
ncbi:hypothetical protein ACFQU7_36035 [Pseudoroseomonas wenyumeiae]